MSYPGTPWDWAVDNRVQAASDIETVNALWKGLGYYSRAARLLQGAQKAVEELGGRLPDNAGDMEREMPGIGRYSAGAICSIAYNQCVPVVSRVFHFSFYTIGGLGWALCSKGLRR